MSDETTTGPASPGVATPENELPAAAVPGGAPVPPAPTPASTTATSAAAAASAPSAAAAAPPAAPGTADAAGPAAAAPPFAPATTFAPASAAGTTPAAPGAVTAGDPPPAAGTAAPVPPDAPRTPAWPQPPSGGPTPPTPPGPPAPPVPPQDGAPAGSPARPTPPGRGRRVVAVLTATGLMLASATGGALVALGLDHNDTTPRTVASSLTPSSAATGGSASAPDEPLSQAAAAVLPSVVSISFRSSQQAGSGSGIIISSDGEILTNNHVVALVANGGSLTVTLSNGKTVDAEILGRDPATDLAVIKAKGVSGLKPATLGKSSDLHVGDTVLAIGSPLGLDGSVSAGIVSALDRAITLQGESQQQGPFGNSSPSPSDIAVIDAIQTDAAINPGNSGGALINAKGEVVGINTAIASLAQGNSAGQGGNIGVGFAIPIDSARDIANQLADGGKVTHAYMGVRIEDTANGDGARIGGVESGQPAEKAGLQQGDVITKVGDKEITDATDLTAAIRSHKPGDKVTVTYTRNGSQRTAEVTLGQLPSGAGN